MSRKRKSKEKPSFFKVLSNMDFKKLLRLPPTFLRRYDRLNLCGDVKLRVDEYSGRSWNVKLERSNNGTFCFTNGWKKFAEDAALSLGEFVVFSLLAKSEFKVVIYETSFCQREIIPTPSSSLLQEVKVEREANEGEMNINQIKRGKGGCTYFKEGNPLYFATYLKDHHRSRISLPKKFSEASNVKTKKEVRIEKVGRRRYGASVAVDCRSSEPTFKQRVDLSKGWYEFRKANGLELNDHKFYSFEFNPHNQVIYVEEVVAPPPPPPK